MKEYMLTEGSTYRVKYGDGEKIDAVLAGISAFGSGTAYVFDMKGKLFFIPIDGITSMELLEGSSTESRGKEPSGVYYG